MSRATPLPLKDWFGLAAISTFIATFVVPFHELGHLLAGLAFRFPSPVFTYGDIIFADSPAIFKLVQAHSLQAVASDYHPLYQLAIMSGAGPAIAMLGAGLCVLTLRGLAARGKYSPVPFLTGAALTLTQLPMPIRILLRSIPAEHINVDEMGVATFGSLSPKLVVWAETAIIAGLVWSLARYVPKSRRWATWTALLVGIAAGMTLWLGFLGPALFPG